MAKRVKELLVRMEVTGEAIRDFKLNKEDIILLNNGEGYKKYALIPVSENVYRIYMQPQWKEAQKNARDSHCMVKSEKTGKLIRCEGGRKCETCKKRIEYGFRKDFGGSTFSYDMLIEDGLEIEDENSFEDTIINRQVIKELIKYAYKIKPIYGEILELMYELGGDPPASEIVKRLKEDIKARRGADLVKEAKELAREFLS